MTSFRDSYGPWALVAGASEGIGAAFAESIAARGLNLHLLARRAEPLEALAGKLRAAHGVLVRTAPADLGSPGILDDVRRAVGDTEVGLLVYNAAYSLIGPFLEQPLAEKLRMIDINCRGPLILSDELGRAMARRGRGGIVLMTSLAATQGTPTVATYAATKAFNLVLAESLWDELRGHGVSVLACRAGATRTPTFDRTNPAPSLTPIMDAGPVAEQALDVLGKTPSMVPGVLNGAMAFFMQRVMPRRAAVATMGTAIRNMYRRT